MHVRISVNGKEENLIKDIVVGPAEVIALMNSDVIRLDGSDFTSIQRTFAYSGEGFSTLVIDCEYVNNE